MSNLIFAIDGIDLSGKTSISKLLTKMLIKNNIPTIHIKDPKDSVMYNSLIKHILDENIDCISKLLLFLSMRFDIIKKNENIFKEKKVIIFDRYILSSIIYQLRHLNIKVWQTIIKIHKIMFNCMPNMHFITHIDYVTFKDRLSMRIKNKKADALDMMSYDMFNEINNAYQNIPSSIFNNIVNIATNNSNIKTCVNIIYNNIIKLL